MFEHEPCFRAAAALRTIFCKNTHPRGCVFSLFYEASMPNLYFIRRGFAHHLLQKHTHPWVCVFFSFMKRVCRICILSAAALRNSSLANTHTLLGVCVFSFMKQVCRICTLSAAALRPNRRKAAKGILRWKRREPYPAQSLWRKARYKLSSLTHT